MARGGLKITIQGEKTLTRKLAALESKVARKVVRQAMRAAMKAMLAEVKQNVPVGETGDMKASTKLRAMKRSRRGFGLEVIVESPGVGAVEFGTVDQAPQAPLRRAFEAQAGAVRDDAIRRIRDGILKEATTP